MTALPLTHSRTLSEALGREVWKVRRAPSGRALCRFCQEEVPKGRRTFCGEPCVHEWRVRNSTTYARGEVKKRDRGVCKECGRDTLAIRARLQRRLNLHRSLDRAPRLRALRWQRMLDRLGLLSSGDVWKVKSPWQMDHVVEVVNGGGTCGLENLQTLCVPCHKRKTRRLAADRAAARRQSKGQL